ncbi:LOW QUALITY PROTEIN: fatty acyl-CoA reductase 2-like, partial [Aphomia sociella]
YVMWYPNFSFTESRFMNTFWEVSCHLPAFLYDMVLRAQGRKAIMMKLARRFKMAADGEYFANHEWQFGISELQTLNSDASHAVDHANFPYWPVQFNWETYIGAYMLGIRRFILKDTPESLPNARTKLKRLYWVHRLFQAATGYYIFKMLAGRLR